MAIAGKGTLAQFFTTTMSHVTQVTQVPEKISAPNEDVLMVLATTAL